MSIEKTIRSQARKKLRGNYVLAVAAQFSVFALMITALFGLEIIISSFGVLDEEEKIRTGAELVYITAVLIAVIAVVLFSPVKNGFLRLFYRIACGEEAGYGDVFYYFKKGRYLPALGFNLVLLLKKLIKAFLCLVPYIVLSVMKITLGFDSAFYDITGVVLIVFAVCVYILWTLKYFISEFIYIDSESRNFSAIYSVTNHIFKRHRGDVYMLWCSFLPWIGLCFFVLPALYVIPYALTSAAVSTKWLLKIYKDGKMI